MYVSRLRDCVNAHEFGTKAVALARMQNSGFPVTNGFVISREGFNIFMEKNGMAEKIGSVHNSRLDRKAMEGMIKDIFLNASVPADLKSGVGRAYDSLSVGTEVRQAGGAALDFVRAGRNQGWVAVRTSVMGSAGKSFAGITRSFMNIIGEDGLWESIRLCWAQLFHPRSIDYRNMVSEDGEIWGAVIVQRMADPEKCGMMLTDFCGDRMIVEASWGLGNAISTGVVTPDQYIVNKSDLRVAEKRPVKKTWMFSKNELSGKTERRPVPADKAEVQTLADNETRKLCEIGLKIHSLFTEPQIVDWCISRGRVFILDSKPFSFENAGSPDPAGRYEVVLKGNPNHCGTADGEIAIHQAGGDFQAASKLVLTKAPQIDILVSGEKKTGFISGEGGKLCNFQLLAKELKVPSVSGVQNAFSVLREGESVRLDSDSGKIFRISDGIPQAQLPESSGGFIQPVEIKEESFGASQGAPTAIKLYCETGTGPAERVEGADGVFLNVGDAQEMANHGLQDGPAHEKIRWAISNPVWIRPKGAANVTEAADLARNLSETGFTRSGVLIPVAAGSRELDGLRTSLNQNTSAGLSLKTPAMVLSVEDLMDSDVKMVCIELRSLYQLSMGLQKPETDIHRSVLRMIAGCAKKCREGGVAVCISVPKEQMTHENIEHLIRSGTDSLSTEVASFPKLREMTQRVEKKMLLETRSDFLAMDAAGQDAGL